MRMPYAYVYIHNMYVSCICKIRKIHVFTCIYVCFICGNYLSIQHTHVANSQEHEVPVSTTPWGGKHDNCQKFFWTLKVHVHPLRVYTCRFTKAWGESASDNKEVCVLPLKLSLPNLKKNSSWDDAIWRIPLSFSDVSVFRRGGVPADSPRVDPVPGRAARGEGSYFGAVHILWTPHGWCKYGEHPILWGNPMQIWGNPM